NIGFHLRASRPSWQAKLEVAHYWGSGKTKPEFKRYLVGKKSGRSKTILTDENSVAMVKIYPTATSRQPTAVLLLSSLWDYHNGKPVCQLTGQVLYGGW